MSSKEYPNPAFSEPDFLRKPGKSDEEASPSDSSSDQQSGNWADRYGAALPHLERKRFRVSLDGLWRNRLHVAREAVLELQKQHPEIIALNFYGSATKGYANAESDMDALLFLDGKSVSDEERILLERTGSLSLSDELKQDIQRRLGDNDHPELSFTVRIINQEDINNSLDEILNAIESLGNSTSRINDEVFYFGQKCESLGEIFTGISVGSTLLEYRKTFLEKLLSRGEAGQVLWKEIIGYIRKKERPISRPGFEDVAVRDNSKYENLYPQTLEEAVRYFVEREPFRGSK